MFHVISPISHKVYLLLVFFLMHLTILQCKPGLQKELLEHVQSFPFMVCILNRRCSGHCSGLVQLIVVTNDRVWQ